MTLRSTIATPEGKRRYVRWLFATISGRYDFITRFLSVGQDRRWKRRLIELAAIGGADRVLDLACGTGDLAFAAALKARGVLGLDITHPMLQLARRRADSGAGRRPGHGAAPVQFVAGDMLALPVRDGSVDVVTVGYGLRNVVDLSAALAEIHRVLAPGGRLLSLDFNRPSNPVVRTIYLSYLTAVGSLLGLALHGNSDTYRYIPESIRLYPGAAGVSRLLEAAGFRMVREEPVLAGLLVIHSGRKAGAA